MSLSNPTIFEGEPEEWMRLHAECLTEKGWFVELNDDGLGYHVSGVNLENRDVFDRASDECDGKIGILPPPVRPSDAEFQEQYESLLKAKACLEVEGYRIEDPPSFEVFLETWEAGPWHPYASLPATLDHEEWVRLNEVCPQP